MKLADKPNELSEHKLFNFFSQWEWRFEIINEEDERGDIKIERQHITRIILTSIGIARRNVMN